MVPPPLSAHPSRGSWPHRELHRRPQGPRSHAVPPPLSAHPHEDRGLIGSSTEGPKGRGHMRYRPRFRRTPHEDRGLIGSSTEGPGGRGHIGAPTQFGTPLTRIAASYGGSTEAPLTRIVASYGAPPKAPAGGSACGSPQQYFGTPRTRIAAPSPLSSPPGSSSEGPEGRVRAACCPRQTCRRADQPQRVTCRCNPLRLTFAAPSVLQGRAQSCAGLPQRVTSQCNPLRLTSAIPSATSFCPAPVRRCLFAWPYP